MKYCQNCGKALPDGAMFCEDCGTQCDSTFNNYSNQNNYSYNEKTVLVSNYHSNNNTNDNSSSNNGQAQYHQANNYGQEFQQPNNYNQAYQQPSYNYYSQNQPYQNNYDQQNHILTYKEFYDQFASKNAKGNMIAIGIICILTALISIRPLVFGNYFSIIDIIFYAVFAILIFTTKHWVLPLIVTCYGGIFSVLGVILAGSPNGVVAVIVGIMATISVKKVHEAYNKYLTTGELPTQAI